MEQFIEFSVAGFVEGVSGLFHVIGRCGDNLIRLGDIFESVYHYSYQRRADGEDAKAVDIEPICLKVENINAYEHDLSVLGQGMTAQLSLSGTGAQLVRPPCVIGTLVPVTANGVIQQTSKSAASN